MRPASAVDQAISAATMNAIAGGEGGRGEGGGEGGDP